jgi:hypothetical protein
MTMGELMRINAGHFAKLKETSAAAIQTNASGCLAPDLVEPLMEAAVAANFSIQQVASLEQVFISEHPHLNTVYRVFAALVFVESVQEVTKIVSSKSLLASRFSEKHAVEFLGDTLESVFRNQSDPHNKSKVLVKDFLKRWKIRENVDAPVSSIALGGDMSIQQVFVGMQQVVRLEVAIQ